MLLYDTGMTLHDELGEGNLLKCSWGYAFVCCRMTLHDEKAGGSNQMLLDLCFCMTLHDEMGGGYLNQMLLELCLVCCCMTLHDEMGRGYFHQMPLGAMRLYDTA